MATIQDVINAAERLKTARNSLDAVRDDITAKELEVARLKTQRGELNTEVDAAKVALRIAAAELV